MERNKAELKVLVRSAYDLQKLRVQMALRIVASFKAKLGQAPGQSERELDSEGQSLLRQLRRQYARITDGITAPLRDKEVITRLGAMSGEGLLSTFAEFVLVHHYQQLLKDEESQFSSLERALKEFPIYTSFLKGVKGCGPAMSAVIVSEIDIHRAKYPSSIWKYAGLDCASDGRGRSRKAEHLVDVKYVSKDGSEKERRSITFNPFLKTKLVGVLGSCFLRAGENKYSDIYRNYKHRLENHAVYRDVSKGHRHAMAQRYMVKMFLVDLYNAWRPLEGLEVMPPYSAGKLGLNHAASTKTPIVKERAGNGEAPEKKKRVVKKRQPNPIASRYQVGTQ